MEQSVCHQMYLLILKQMFEYLLFDKSKSSDKVILIDASKMGEEYQDGKNKKIRLRDNEIEKIIETFVKKENVDDF